MIEFKEVTKTYNGVHAVEHLNFFIKKGEFITILGSSGSGKTTTLKMINRLIEPTSGQIWIDGQDIRDQDAIELRRSIGYVVQEIGLFPHMTIEENIATVPKLLGWDMARINQRTVALMSLMKLPYDRFSQRYPHELSGGQQQRVGVARALAADPQMMLFDEPLGAIDAINRYELQNELKNIHLSLGQKTFVLITHDIMEALRLGNRVMIMHAGKIVQFDTPKAIMQAPASEYVKALIQTVHDQNQLWSDWR